MAEKDKKVKLTHEEGVGFLTALITLIYNFVKSLKKKPKPNELSE